MMKKLLQLVYMCAALLTTTILTHTGCKKPTDNPATGNNTPTPAPCDTCLPPIATEGNSMFGCRVNGKVWLPKEGWMQPAFFADFYNGSISISGTNSTVKEGIGFALEKINDTVTVYFPSNNFSYTSASFTIFKTDLYKEYFTTPIDNGYIKFTRFDINKGAYAGLFEFDVYSRDLQDTIHITDGRFLIHK
jgi:hypothetical protein